LKLATIEFVTSLSEIPGFDNLMLVQAGGQETVAPVGLFSVGDKCIIVHQGAIFPKWAEVIGRMKEGRVLRRNDYIVRRATFRGAYPSEIESNCMALHISLLQALNPGYVSGLRLPGDEVGDLLGLGYVADYNGKEVAFLPSTQPIDINSSAPTFE
jgi:hypothetical protein